MAHSDGAISSFFQQQNDGIELLSELFVKFFCRNQALIIDGLLLFLELFKFFLVTFKLIFEVLLLLLQFFIVRCFFK